MKATWEKIENNTGVLTVEVGPERVAKALDTAFKKVAARVNVPGFRKGKVPRQIFEARFGVESLYQDALDVILPEVYVEAIQETGIEPVDRPEVDVQQIAKGQALKFTAKVTVKPEVQLGEYKGLEVAEASAEVTDEELEEELKRLQQRHAELETIDEGEAQNGDTVNIDFEGFLGDTPFEGGQANSYSLELGSGSFIPGFEEQVVGMKKGEERDIKVSFPEDYHAAELKGQAAVFKVSVNEIKRKNLPALDDEFAKDVSEFETLEEFKQDLVKRVQERKEQNALRDQENAVVEKAADNATIDIPEAMVKSEIDQMIGEFENRLKMQGMTLDMYYQFSGQDEAAVRAQMHGDAERRVRNNLVLEAIAKAENIEASDEDIHAELEKMAGTYQRSVEEIRRILTANGSLEGMKNDLTVRKTVNFLLEHSKKVEAVA